MLISFIFISIVGGSFKSSTVVARKFADEVTGIERPDTKLTRAVFDHAQGVCPDWLLNHCMRSYILSHLIASEISAKVARKDLTFFGALLRGSPLHNSSSDEINVPFEQVGARYSRKIMAQFDNYANRHEVAGTPRVTSGWITQIRAHFDGGPSTDLAGLLPNNPWRNRSREQLELNAENQTLKQ